MKRNILTIKKSNNLDDSELFLYLPYKNIVRKFYNLATKKTAIQFDAVSRNFSGIDNADADIKHHYEALLGVTSYFQASKGGRGKYIEKKIASISESCLLNVSISELPKIFNIKNIIRKKKLVGYAKLTSEEKNKLNLDNWDFISEKNNQTDLINVFPHSISFLELKNRIDSGGVAARREILIKKLPFFLNFFIKNQKIYRCNNNEYSFYDFLRLKNINKISFIMGLLFNVSGEPATIEGDKSKGFYSSNVEGYKFLSNFLNNHNEYFVIEKENLENLYLKVKYKDLIIEIVTAYGNDITKCLFDKDINVNQLLLNPYDDIWLFQLLAIEQRSVLLKTNNNILKVIENLIVSNYDYRIKINDFINNGGNKFDILNDFIKKIEEFDIIIPNGRYKMDYIHDLIYFYCSYII